MMKKLLFSLPCLLTAYFTTAQVPNEKSLLWKIEGKTLSQPSYLYGTIHIMCPDDITISTKLKTAFNSTRQLYLELDLDNPSTMARMMMGMMMTDGSSLKTLLAQKDYDSVAAIFQSTTRLSLNMLNRAKPILLMSMIYPSLLGCTPEGWEQAFMKMAKEKEMNILGLEDVTDQISVLDSIPYQVQANMFLKTMYNLDSARTSFNKMVEIYKKQDIEEMIRMTSADEDYGDYEQVMLVKRNRNWIPVMEQAMEKNPSFFAVGAAHLGGEHGVIRLLRDAGYTVTAVKY
jgi:uncharacterized protein YbaP (TraB family)